MKKIKAGYYLERNPDCDGFAVVYPDGSYDFGDENGDFVKVESPFPFLEFTYLCDLAGKASRKKKATQIKAFQSGRDRREVFMRKNKLALPKNSLTIVEPVPPWRPSLHGAIYNHYSQEPGLGLSLLDKYGPGRVGMTKTELSFMFFLLLVVCAVGSVWL